MRKVVVTGSGGFVGRALIPALARAGVEPVGVGRREVGSVGPDTDWKPFIKGANAVVHLAAMVHVMHAPTLEESSRLGTVNVEGTEKLARDAAESGVRRLVFLSSSKVMGDMDRGRAFTEADEPVPGDEYARSKLQAETRLRKVADETGLEVAIIRPPLVYGPEVKGNFLSLLGLCARPWPVPFGSVRNRRSLMSVSNLSDAICRCVTEGSAAGLTAFVRDGKDLSTPELIAALRRGMGRKARLMPFPTRALAFGLRAAGRGAMATRLLSSFTLDDSLFRSTLGWSAPQPPEEGLVEVARWFARQR